MPYQLWCGCHARSHHATSARSAGYRRMNRIAALMIFLAAGGCTRWDTTNLSSTYGPRRELARRMVGAPTVEEVTQSGVTAGIGGSTTPTMAGGTVAVGGLSAGMTSVKRT